MLRPWGGGRIARRFGWDDQKAVGEWWLASSHSGTETALSDGSGNLASWLDQQGQARGCPGAAEFPLLLKFLDAEQILSLQVHPNDEVAIRHGLPGGKTEAWHILDADRSACVYLGTTPGVSCTQLLDRIEAGASDDEVLSMMHRMPVRPGDTLYVEAGTIHAIAGGLSLFEVQQNSDATYRIHDWGRGRDLHLGETRDAMTDATICKTIHPAVGDAWTPLVDSPAFRLARAKPELSLGLEPGGSYALLTLIAGEGEIRAEGGSHAKLSAGDTLLVLDPVELRGTSLDLLVVRPGV